MTKKNENSRNPVRVSGYGLISPDLANLNVKSANGSALTNSSHAVETMLIPKVFPDFPEGNETGEFTTEEKNMSMRSSRTNDLRKMEKTIFIFLS